MKFTLHNVICRSVYSFRQECDNIGGTQDGTCADGFGVCCTGMIFRRATIGGIKVIKNSLKIHIIFNYLKF